MSRSKLTLPEYFLEWYERYRKPDIRESTQARYINKYHRVINLFDGIKLDQLTTPLIQDKLDEYGKTVAYTTVAKFWDVVKSSLRDAHIDGLIKKDIWSRVSRLDQLNVEHTRAFYPHKTLSNYNPIYITIL
ncbi:hypothetical protein [Leuconostoc suionicum]|uniref:hypothetical protein n=1 Tax=Leuconostoc suionicum TaxID=1511761 RepID=UPI003D15C44C